MSISLSLIEELRKKTASGPFIFLMEFFNESNSAIMRLTNYKSNFDFAGSQYTAFPFVVSIPEFSDDLGQTLQLTFGNFSVPNYNTIKRDLQNTVKIFIHFVNVDEPTESIFPTAVYFFTEGDSYRQDDTSIRVTFSRKILNDKKYPFRRYNSEQHPTLYEDFADAPLK